MAASLPVCLFLAQVLITVAVNLEYLDPTKLQTIKSPAEQEEAAKKVLNEYFPDSDFIVNNVSIKINAQLFKECKDVFVLNIDNHNLLIEATSGVAALWGFNHYLKKYCKGYIDRDSISVGKCPELLDARQETVVANDRFRFYGNMESTIEQTWWSVEKWKNHLRWMAFNGINLVLAPVAQEAAWLRIYQRYNLTQREIDQHFTGPAYLYWLRKGELRGFGGPLPESYMTKQKEIQQVTVNSMHSIGMIPMYPGFDGFVPTALKEVFPDSSFIDFEPSAALSNSYSVTTLVDPTQGTLFNMLGEMFLKEIQAIAPSNHIYFINLNVILNRDVYLRDGYDIFELAKHCAKAILSTLIQVDDKAVWAVEDEKFYKHASIFHKFDNFLGFVPNGRMLLFCIDRDNDMTILIYKLSQCPFIWSTFKTNRHFFKHPKLLNERVFDMRFMYSTKMIGLNLTPLEIESDEIIFDFLHELVSREKPVDNLEAWFAGYAERRYGCNATADAWQYLLRSVFSSPCDIQIPIMNTKPTLKASPLPPFMFKKEDLFMAFRKFTFVKRSTCNSKFDEDLKEVTRLALQYRATQIYIQLKAYAYRDVVLFENLVKQFLDVLEDIKQLLYLTNSGQSPFELWLTSAKQMATNEEEEYLYEMNARNVITLSFRSDFDNRSLSDIPFGEVKQWAELYDHYYIGRWRDFLNTVVERSKQNKQFPDEVTSITSLEREFQYKDITASRDIEQTGESVADIARRLHKKWAFFPGIKGVTEPTFCMV